MRGRTRLLCSADRAEFSGLSKATLDATLILTNTDPLQNARNLNYSIDSAPNQPQVGLAHDGRLFRYVGCPTDYPNQRL